MQNLSWRILFQEQIKFLKSDIWFQFYSASNKDTFFTHPVVRPFIPLIAKFLASKLEHFKNDIHFIKIGKAISAIQGQFLKLFETTWRKDSFYKLLY